MSENHIYFWQHLCEEQQESLVGGQGENILATSNFFFQKTDIQSQADNNLNLGEDESGTQTTKYNLSQITMASSITFTLQNFPSPGNSLNNLIAQIIRGFIS
ncbi:hypothetical protein NWP22_08380 [Anabaenopsis tanganyikae CS-531]|uniref:Uncharacterized protein n=2 Tax=Anabaenopsis TaxID=110103 RepID=A0ABT6KEQ1_9CYAN|nr:MULTISPECIES: hypothetical protein [Anabaenopsis]MDB9541174.1 hypothetical protein [Anabaenopsis arnoldii]MDH6093613.1 hypothetical protein [Anabaenopsis arnoldii]MDH6105879.1 hypothetical protein [Anabaenopsis tanganyikae CS-531]